MVVGMVLEDAAGDERVLAGGRRGDAEDQGQVERVGPGGECLVEDPVAADALKADAVASQVPGKEAAAHGAGAERGPLRDQDVLVRGMRPGGAPVTGSDKISWR